MTAHVIAFPERLRVMQMAPSLGVGGAEQMAGHLMVRLTESFDVSAVALYPPFKSSIEQKLADSHIPLYHLDKHPGFDGRLFGAIRRLIKSVDPHVVHTHLSVLRYVLPGVMGKRRPVVVHTLHNLAERETDAFGRFLQWFAFRGVVIPVAISQEVARSVERVYGIECPNIVPNCIPVDQYCRGEEDRKRWRETHGFAQDDIVLTCVGRLEPQKNPILLIDAFAAVGDPRVHLVLLGDGGLREQVASHIRERGLTRCVHLLGKLPDIPEALAGSDIFVLSSDWEGSPLAVIEAMASGLPVVGTAVGGVPELVESGRHGILVPPRECAAFTNALRVLVNDAEKRAEMGAAAKARAHTAFSLDRMARGYADVYCEALGRSSQSPVPTAAF